MLCFKLPLRDPWLIPHQLMKSKLCCNKLHVGSPVTFQG